VDNFPSRRGVNLRTHSKGKRGGKARGKALSAPFVQRREFLIDNSRRDGARVMYQLIRGFIARRRERSERARVFMPRAGRFVPRSISASISKTARTRRIVARLRSWKPRARLSDALWLRRSGEGEGREGIFCPGACCTYRIGFHVGPVVPREWILGYGL